MDPLSITSGVIAVIQLATQIISVCQDYITNIQDAPTDLRNIIIEVGSINSVLGVIKLLESRTCHGRDSMILTQLKAPNGALSACEQTLLDLDALIPPLIGHSTNGKRYKIAPLDRLAWPLKVSKARKLLEKIGQLKSTISLALTVDTTYNIKKISNHVEHIRGALSRKEREDILKWLVTTDPSPKHNRACSLHEPHTGKWFIASPEHKEWMSGSNRALWLHGIPGAGKTVLFSFIVESVKQYLKSTATPSTGLAYYYCSFDRAQDETPHLLRWVMSQLCHQLKYIPDEIRELYDAGSEPTTKSLVLALSATLHSFRRVYLFIDALDESLDRQRLLDMIVQLAGSDFEAISLLVMSRKELDIIETLESVFSSLSLSNPRVDEDIRVYIQSELRSHRKFSRWPTILKEDIEAALVKGAQGMFRWAFCQLDILRKLTTESAIREALGQLPKTLDETYERILISIPTENRLVAHRALQWLAFSSGFAALDSLAKAVSMDIERYPFSSGSELLDPKDLLEICSCLITATCVYNGYWEEPVLAHYTVKEFLVSERIKIGPANDFYVSETSTLVLIAKSYLVYLLSDDYANLCDENDIMIPVQTQDTHPFLFYSVVYWQDCVKSVEKGGGDATVTDLVLKLLDPREPHFRALLEQSYVHSEDAGKEILPDWSFRPGAESSATLAYLCNLGLVRAAEVHINRNPDPSIFKNRLEPGPEFWYNDSKFDYGTPVEIVKKLQDAALIELFTQRGADMSQPISEESDSEGSFESYGVTQ